MMKKDLTLVILAAGMGSRFGGLKQVEPVGPNGEFIIDYSIYDAIQAGFTKVVFIIKEEMYDLFRETVGKRIEGKIQVEYAFQKIDDVPEFVNIPSERTKPWGTAHAILSAKDKVNSNFVMINSDDFYGRDAYLKIKDSYSFDIKNVESVDNQYRVSFYLGSNKITESAKVALVEKKDFPKEGLKPGSYSLTVTADGQPTSTLIIKLTDYTNIKSLKNLILFQLDPKVFPFEINLYNKQDDRILLQSLYPGKTLKITDGLDGKNLLDYFDIEPIEFGSSPLVNTEILKFHNLTISHIRNIESGEDKSFLRFALEGIGLLEVDNSSSSDSSASNDSSTDSSNDGSLDSSSDNSSSSDDTTYEEAKTEQYVDVQWNSDSIHLDNIEVDFDDRLMYIFINGELKAIQFLDNKPKKTEQTLELLGKKNYAYSFDEIIINNKCIHTKDFKLSDKQLTKYTTKKPYVDFYFSSTDLKKGMELKVLSQSGIHCCLCDGGNYYYFSSGAVSSFLRGITMRL